MNDDTRHFEKIVSFLHADSLYLDSASMRGDPAFLYANDISNQDQANLHFL